MDAEKVWRQKGILTFAVQGSASYCLGLLLLLLPVLLMAVALGTAFAATQAFGATMQPLEISERLLRFIPNANPRQPGMNPAGF